ncbi:MAG: hypothetical protein ACO1N0_01185 [Fluviicola sp.]
MRGVRVCAIGFNCTGAGLPDGVGPAGEAPFTTRSAAASASDSCWSPG